MCIRDSPESTVPDLGHIDLTTTFKAYDCSTARHTEEEIKQALSAVGKNSPEDELNCSGCGYDSCRDFAVALVEGRAEENMCVSYMRLGAQDVYKRQALQSQVKKPSAPAAATASLPK